METLLGMGFPPARCTAALSLSNNNTEAALDMLLNGDPRVAEAVQAAAAAPPPPPPVQDLLDFTAPPPAPAPVPVAIPARPPPPPLPPQVGGMGTVASTMPMGASPMGASTMAASTMPTAQPTPQPTAQQHHAMLAQRMAALDNPVSSMPSPGSLHKTPPSSTSAPAPSSLDLDPFEHLMNPAAAPPAPAPAPGPAIPPAPMGMPMTGTPTGAGECQPQLRSESKQMWSEARLRTNEKPARRCLLSLHSISIPSPVF